jgi:preprotein translocase subunit SecA
LTYAYGGPEGFTNNPYAAEFVRDWALAKYGVPLSLEYIASSGLAKLRNELIVHQEHFLSGGKLDKTVEELIQKNSKTESLVEAANERFSTQLSLKDFEVAASTPDGDGRALKTAATPEQVREILLQRGRQFLRRELSELEQYVLIQILDQTWKDHLYAMDMLKAGIGLIAFAEQDPRVQYKKEGFRYFTEMMASVRDKVTDLIFRARIVGAAPQARSAYKETAAVHEESGGYGVGENIAATAGAVAGAPAGSGEMQEAADRVQGEATKVKQIVREAPKVGRNDLCPCGSGKKYKRCCGATAA